VGGRQRLTWKLSASLLPGQSLQIELVSLVGAVAPGKLENIAIASGSVGSGTSIITITTEASTALVEVRQGVFDDQSVLVGRVYLDRNHNNSYEEGSDEGLAGARVYLSNGRYAVTDKKGRFSLPEVEAGLYALRLDPLTVPYLPKPVPDDQGMPGNRYGRTPVGGGVVNEDFPLYPVEVSALKTRTTLVKRGPVQLEKSVVQSGSGYVVTLKLSLSERISGLSLADPVPASAQRSEPVLMDGGGKQLELKTDGQQLLLPAELAAGSYTLRYTLSTNLAPDQVLSDPDIQWEVKR
jgi:hypothetical protein